MVTYDLAVARFAKQIQATAKPPFDNVFVMLRSFHTEMFYISPLGQIIGGSGGPSVLMEVEAAETRSLYLIFMQDEEFSDERKDMLRKWVSGDDDVIPESLDMIALKLVCTVKICLEHMVKLLSFG